VSENVIAGSDRILHYCNNLFALSRRDTAELEQEGPDPQYKLHATHRLQLLASRGNQSFYTGYNLIGDLPSITFTEASVQPPEVYRFLSEE